MATKDAIVRGLALMHEAFPTRAITRETAPAWSALLRDVTDAAFLSACVSACREPGRTFFPTTGEIMAYARPKLALDHDKLLHAIQQLGEYNPHVGWLCPKVDKVREHFGQHVASAYGMAGASRCFSDNDTSRDIATRVFASELENAPANATLLRPFLIGAPTTVALPSGDVAA